MFERLFEFKSIGGFATRKAVWYSSMRRVRDEYSRQQCFPPRDRLPVDRPRDNQDQDAGLFNLQNRPYINLCHQSHADRVFF